MPQKFFDLVKSSNFCAPLKLGFLWFTTEHGESGESKSVTSLRERTLRLSQSGLLFCLSVEAFLPHKVFAGAPQSTDFCFYQQYLLLRRILKWALAQKTPKFIISLKRMTTRTYQHRSVNTLNDDDRADLYADNSLANEEWTASQMRWMLTKSDSSKNSNELWWNDQKAMIWQKGEEVKEW